ncbi:MAG TPA: chloride channel protein [Candidatus Paceibacterota bacterium]|nr:chloride channel protein [Candidatus Paceibacterota bacterium]
MNLSKLNQLMQRLPARGRTILVSCVYGLSAGAAAVAFQLGINWVFKLGLVRLSHDSKMVFLFGSLAILVGSSLLVGWLLSAFCPEAAGSGIPQNKLAFWKDFGAMPWRVAWVKFVAGIISVGGGASLGREGPSVQVGGALASNLAGLAGEAKQNRRAASAAGAAAGLAAAFNAPLASTTFVLEEIIGDLNSRLLGSVLLAAVLGALVVHGIIGKQPSFSLHDVQSPTWVGYLLTPPVAALASLVGVYFQRYSLGLRAHMMQLQKIPGWLAPVFGGLLTWVLGVAVFWRTGHLGVFGLGYGVLSSALAGDLGWQLAAVLLITKFIATFSCYGFGGCGGIFSPTLFFGGMVGIIVAGLLNLEFSVSRGDVLTLAVVGMSACLGAVVWAPVTGILIVFEMTQEFSLVPALMIGALISQTVARRMNTHNFYDELLHQDGHRIDHVRPPRDLQSWEQFPVSAIANFEPVVITSLDATELKKVLKAHPYRQFPVVLENKLQGVLTREEAEEAFTEKRAVRLKPATVCLRDAAIGKLQLLLIESVTQFTVVLDRKNGQVVGVVTLHDLLRAQTMMAQQSEDL